MAGGTTMVVCSGLIMMTTLMSGSWTGTAKLIIPWIFLAGAIAYVVIQRMQTYNGTSMTIQRLRSIQLLSGVCFIGAGLLMIENFCQIVQPLVVNTLDSYVTYMQIVHNNWVVLMLIGAVLQMYTAHRLGSELQKES